MIDAGRFIANKALDWDGWLNARRYGVTATQVAKAATDSGFQEVLADMRETRSQPDNPFMAFGRNMEGPLSLWVKEQFGVMPNEWLIAGENPDDLATPDGLSLDHTEISEIKTTGRDFEKSIPIQYRRQVQWQLWVTGAQVCHFVWMLRVEDHQGDFQPGWIEPKHTVIERDDDMMKELSSVALRLLIEKDGVSVTS